MMDDLPDCLGWQMEAKQGTGPSGGKTLATCPTVEQIAAFVFAVFATNGNVPLTS
jgi:hypothetical protein